MSLSFEKRVLVEINIVKKTISELSSKYPDCFFLVTDEFGENLGKKSRDFEIVFDACMGVDYAYLGLHHKDDEMFGGVSFTFGNDGWNLISDYSEDLESDLKSVFDYANSVEKNYFNEREWGFLVETINDSFGSIEEAIKKEVSKISWLYSPNKSKGSGSEFVTKFIDSMIDGSPVSLLTTKELTTPNALTLSYIYTAYCIDRSLVEDILRSVFR